MLTRQGHQHTTVAWYPFHKAAWFILRHPRLLGWSLLLVGITVCLSWLGYYFAVDCMDRLTEHFFSSVEAGDSFWGWLERKALSVGEWLYRLFSRFFAFYLSFLLAYSLTTPGYAFLSLASEKMYAGADVDPEDAWSLKGLCLDLLEGLKMVCLGLVVTLIAVVINLVPGLGQIAVFLLYTFTAALMFLDYPASRRRWVLKKKLSWLLQHPGPSFRLGLLPAVVGMIPVVHIFLMALLFPILTVSATLNFLSIESRRWR